MIFKKLLVAIWVRIRGTGTARKLVILPEPSPTKSRRRRRRKPSATNHPPAPTKAETALLEPFPCISLQDVHVPKSREELVHAAEAIRGAGVTGFDTESKPVFHAGQKNEGPHVVQFALKDRAFIFQLHHPGSRELVSGLLESAELLKVGFGLKNDLGQIRSEFGIEPKGIVDLDQVMAKNGFSKQMGVRAAIASLFNKSFPKSKRVTTSNWAAHDLTPKQLLYAANDAYAALCVMEALEKRGAVITPAQAPPPKKSRSRSSRAGVVSHRSSPVQG